MTETQIAPVDFRIKFTSVVNKIGNRCELVILLSHNCRQPSIEMLQKDTLFAKEKPGHLG
jgi:hypothetical protein